jgi:TolB protein
MAELSGKIVFTSGAFGDTDLWRIDLDTGELKQLTFGNWRNWKGRWSPDGTRIVYVSNKQGPSDLWLMDADGGNQQRLTTDGRWYDHPDWSPDGTQIVCCSNREGTEDNEVWILTLREARWERRTECGADDAYPAWSPDGKRIAFSSARSGSDDVWALELASGKLQRLTDAPGRDFAPAWSPDGRRVAFVADRAVSWRDRLEGDPDLDVWLMNADGTGQHRLTSNQGTDRCASWSPDGTHLVYSASKPSDTGERLWVLPVGGGQPAEIGLDRAPLEAEIGVSPVTGVGLFSLFPESIVRKFYPDSYFGTESYPHWGKGS